MRTRTSQGDTTHQPSSGRRSTRKRELPQAQEEAETVDEQTPSKRRRSSRYAGPRAVDGEDEADTRRPSQNGGGMSDAIESNEILAGDEEPAVVQTPIRRRPGRPRANPGGGSIQQTPVKTSGTNRIDTPRRRDLADRSARRKSARTLIDRIVAGATSDDEGGDEGLARAIYESSDDEGEEVGEESGDEEAGQGAAALEAPEDLIPDTPSKRRGRPPKEGGRKGAGAAAGGKRRKKSPTPPRDLPRHEQYFWQNKPGSQKTSGNKLSSLDLLTHDEYFSRLRGYTDRHEKDIEFLGNLQAASFRQWEFEMSQGFGVCLYGYGSKRLLLQKFAGYLYKRWARHPGDDDNDGDNDDDDNDDDDNSKDRGCDEEGASETTSRSAPVIVVINGYVRTSSVKEMLSTIARAVSPGLRLPSSNPVTMAQSLSALLSSSPTPPLTLVVHSIDAPPMRRAATQAILARLASHPRVRFVCSADTASFALLWDVGLRSLLNLAFHDATTFRPPSAAELDAVDEAHELLGRRARRAGGKDGVVFVLRSLPENAKSLFRLLVTEVLVAAGEEGDGGGAAASLGGSAAEMPGVEYRMVYNRAVEEFICSSEMAFRTLLKEFHDHQIITSRKDPLGTELLCLPFRKEELEGILEDLM